VEGLARAARLIESREGRQWAALVQSSRVPRAEREALLAEASEGLGLPDEVARLVEALAARRQLRTIPAILARSSAVAAAAAEVAPVDVRTARPLDEAGLARLGELLTKTIGRPVRFDVKEDPGLLAGLVVRSGNRIWDGSLAGRLARARDAVAGAAAGEG
jgi:F-type H+-transporting ATPase subunit delta